MTASSKVQFLVTSSKQRPSWQLRHIFKKKPGSGSRHDHWLPSSQRSRWILVTKKPSAALWKQFPEPSPMGTPELLLNTWRIDPNSVKAASQWTTAEMTNWSNHEDDPRPTDSQLNNHVPTKRIGPTSNVTVIFCMLSAHFALCHRTMCNQVSADFVS